MCSICLHSCQKREKNPIYIIGNDKHQTFGTRVRICFQHPKIDKKKKLHIPISLLCFPFDFHALHAINENMFFFLLPLWLYLSIDFCYFKCYSWLIVQFDSLIRSLCYNVIFFSLYFAVSVLVFNQRWYVEFADVVWYNLIHCRMWLSSPLSYCKIFALAIKKILFIIFFRFFLSHCWKSRCVLCISNWCWFLSKCKFAFKMKHRQKNTHTRIWNRSGSVLSCMLRYQFSKWELLCIEIVQCVL